MRIRADSNGSIYISIIKLYYGLNLKFFAKSNGPVKGRQCGLSNKETQFLKEIPKEGQYYDKSAQMWNTNKGCSLPPIFGSLLAGWKEMVFWVLPRPGIVNGDTGAVNPSSDGLVNSVDVGGFTEFPGNPPD